MNSGYVAALSTLALASCCVAQQVAVASDAAATSISVDQNAASEPATASSTPQASKGDSSSSSSAIGADANPWRFNMTAWIWVVGMDGTAGARGQQAKINASFGDVLEASDSIFAFSGRLEVGKGRWGGFIDGMYSKIGADNQTGPLGITQINVVTEMTLIDFALTYRLGEWKPSGEAAKSRLNTTLDAYAGARYTGLELRLDPAALPSRTQSRDWFDPIVGAKLVLPFGERWHLAVNGDVGGFGASSDVTWSATGVIGYDFSIGSCPATTYVGYRAIGQDYHHGSGANEFTWDVVQHGIILGLGLRF